MSSSEVLCCEVAENRQDAILDGDVEIMLVLGGYVGGHYDSTGAF